MEPATKTPASLSLPWKTRIKIWLLSATTDAAMRKDRTVNRRLINFFDNRIPPTTKPRKGVKTYDVVVDPVRNLWFRVFIPIEHAVEDLPVVVFFHGGGFVFLSTDMKIYDNLCRRFTKTFPAIIVSVNYRLAPEHRYPAQHDDCFDMLKFLDENSSKSLPGNVNISRCFLVGDSAGGNLAHHVAQRACEFNFNRLKRVFFIPIEHAVEDLPVVVFFHGGGFVFLSTDMKIYDNLCRRFTKTFPAIIVSVNYRLAPEHRYPAQHDDCFDMLKFLDENSSKSLPGNVNISRCFLVGDSAGGNLAHHVAQRACEFNFNRLKVIGVVAIQPYFGGMERTDSEIELEGTPVASMKRTDWCWKAFLPAGEGYDRDHPIINVSGAKAVDISKMDFPETMVVVGGFDALKDWQKRYYEWMKNSGKEVYLLDYPNMCHAFYMFPELPESDLLISDVKDFIHRVLNK